MLFGGLMLLGALAAQDMDVITDAWQACTPTDAAILAYISVLGGAASYGVFFYNASIKGNLTALSSLTFLTCVAGRGLSGGCSRNGKECRQSKGCWPKPVLWQAACLCSGLRHPCLPIFTCTPRPLYTCA